jgi:serine/threonine protein kinase
MTVRLGPFLLERPIARGGMAEVWRGVHASEQVPVAVKVLTGPRAREDAFVRALKNEIHAVARLDHPGIITIYDRGEVTVDAAAGSGGRLVEGSPWFAMEMCSHGALSPRRFPLPWKTTRMLLLSLLDALAHAHARGVVHRDLKPGNVLLCAPEDPRPGLKLSDFGIAQPLNGGMPGVDESPLTDAHSGTPRYMAPEQFNGKARELGPWTDLYALGCIAFQLASGEAPFAGDPLRLAVAHCHDPVPGLVATHPGFPAGYEAWVLRLLEKEPRQRFRVAADAAWALLQLTPDDDDITLSDDWEGALHSLKPRPLFPDEEPSARSHVDDTAAHTLGPSARVGAEHPSHDFTPAPPPGVDESTGDALPLRAPLTAADREQPTAIARVPRLSMPPSRATSTSTSSTATHASSAPHETAPTGQPRGQRHAPMPLSVPETAPVIDDDDPFAAVLAVATRDGADDPATDPRTWAPQAPWTELLALADAQPKDEHPTIAGPFDRPGSSERSREATNDRPRRARAPALPPPLPPSWRRPDEPLVPLPPARRLLGAGLGLYGLRQPPFVDRSAERDLLWNAVRRAHGAEGAIEDVVVVVRGPAGIGRSRLLAWLGERAAEVGAATSLYASHSPQQSPGDGIVGAFVRHARANGLVGDALRAQLRHMLGEGGADDVELLANVVERSASAESALRSLPVRERHGVLRRLLAALASKRPVVLVVDDAQWGDDAIAFARSLPGPAPAGRKGVVTVIAVFDEGLAERAAAAAAVDDLARAAGVVSVVLPPLPVGDHRRLVEELLGLEPRLADLVSLRSAGNPRFAVELVGDFVQRGVLELVPSGFALKRGEAAALPDDLHAAWSKRLTHLLAGLPPSARVVLELGAVLGKDGDTSEWLALCRAAGVSDADAVVSAVVDALERARYVVNEQGTVRFAHAMLRESMARLAQESGRLAAHHRLIARFLGDRQRGREHDERRARHLLAAGDLDVALPLLLSSAAAALATAGSVHAVGLVDEAFAALDRHDVPEHDPRRLWAIALRARALADAGRYAEAAMWARLVKDDAPVEARVEASRAMALASLRQGALDDAFARYQALLHHAEALPDSAERAATIDDALLGLADGHYYRGELVAAGARLGEALAHAEARGDDDGVALCLWSSAYVSLWRGDYATARAQLERQQDVSRRAGLRVLAALGENALGDIDRLESRTVEAEVHYQAALAVLRQSGSGKVRVVELNRALCALHVDVDVAVARAEALLPDVARAGERVLLALVHGILAVGAAKAGDWSAVDAHVAVFIAPHQQGLIDGEIGLLAEQLATIAAGAGRPERALQIGTWAREVWSALSRTERLDALPPVG